MPKGIELDAAGRRARENSSSAFVPPEGSWLTETGNDGSEEDLAGPLDGEFVEETTPAPPTGRRGARALAVQALYESDMTGHPADAVVRRLASEANFGKNLLKFAEQLVGWVEDMRESLDSRIAESAPVFPPEQISIVDRNVLRVALVELENAPDTPRSVIVNEAVELARLFGSEGASSFVNGVLGSVLR